MCVFFIHNFYKLLVRIFFLSTVPTIGLCFLKLRWLLLNFTVPYLKTSHRGIPVLSIGMCNQHCSILWMIN